MKVLICCMAILAVATSAEKLTSSEEFIKNLRSSAADLDYTEAREALSTLKQATEEICPGYSSKIEKAIVKLSTCISDIDEDTETMCSAISNHLERCVGPVVRLFEECLPEKSKDLPSLFTKSTVAVVKEVCKTDGEHIFELYNPCIRSRNYRTQRCMRKIKSKVQQYSTKYPSKQEVCDFLSSFKGCLQSHIHASCGHAKTREAFLNMYNAAISPCQDAALNEIETFEPRAF